MLSLWQASRPAVVPVPSKQMPHILSSCTNVALIYVQPMQQVVTGNIEVRLDAAAVGVAVCRLWIAYIAELNGCLSLMGQGPG
jgi:hypothetical protein